MKKAILTTAILVSFSFAGTVSNVYKHLNEIGYTDAQVSSHLTEFRYLTASELTLVQSLSNAGLPLKDCVQLVEKKRTAEKKASKKQL